MVPEEFFLRYAFPCAHVLLETGVINEKRYKELEDCAKTGNFLSRKIIEESFPAAFRRIKMLSHEIGVKDYWDMKVLREYWYNYHNIIIDKQEGNYSKSPEFFRDFCKVHIAKVKEILPEEFLLVEYDDKKRPVSRVYVPEAKVGDKVRIHHAYAIEMVD
ncbi:MAG TPA: hypothetical protein VJB35_04165 [Candidatus Nanoarchaeia archaeon]|nr:hypothetical protein [Candidatus Nanoarchaeia archaeon]